ncbi:MAG: hypothetical protein RL095_2095 [Verrucomicrobiota bacterium]
MRPASLKLEGFDRTQPVFHLYVDGKHLATLFEPAAEDMFWYSYRVEPVDGAASTLLRDPLIWQEIKFSIQDLKGQRQETFSGGYDDFCHGRTSRLSFRSLYPPLSRFPSLWTWLRF